MIATDLARDIEADQQGRELHDRRRMTQQLATEDVTVERTNGNGFRATDGTWRTVSKFACPGDVAMPAVGDCVRLTLDKSNFVRKVEKLARPVPIAPAAGIFSISRGRF